MTTIDNTVTRRQALAGLSALAASIFLPTAHAQSGEIAMLVVGLAAGGATDVAARRLAEKLSGNYARSVLVENKTGAAARLAVQHVKAAAPNGLTLLLTPASMLTIYPHTYPKLAYKPAQDLLAVGMVGVSELGFAVGPAVPAGVGSVADYLAWCKGDTSRTAFGSGAMGSGPHFLGEMVGRHAGVRMNHVGYRGSQPAVLDLLGGHVPAVAAPLGEFLPHMKSGQIRMLGVTGSSRSRFLPEAPTFKEQSLPLQDMTEWFGMFLPAGTPATILQRASAAVQSAVTTAEFANGVAAMGIEARWQTGPELAARMQADTTRWGPIVSQIGFTAES